MQGAEFWPRFEHDPRRPENVALRASYVDRDLVIELLGEAFGDGRLTREEFDERTAAAAGLRTLGEIRPLLADLVSTSSAPVPMSGSALRAAAEQRYLVLRREALLTMLVPSLICWAIYLSSVIGGGGAFPWPLFVTVFTGSRLIRLVSDREGSLNALQRRLERRQVRELRQSDRHHSDRRPPGPPPN